MPVAIGGVTYQIGAGLFATQTGPTAGKVVGTRTLTLGSGIAQVPIYSQKPGGGSSTDAYISVSGGGGTNPTIAASAAMAATPFTTRLQATVPSSQIIHWRDGRIQ